MSESPSKVHAAANTIAPLTVTDLNARGGIGSNCLLLESGDLRLLLDSGIHPKYVGFESLPAIKKIGEGTLDAIVLTHCHLDHLGALPLVAKKQPQAPIITSIPSATLAPRMLHNSVNVMGRQREETGVNELPLYTHKQVDHTAQQMFALPWRQPRRIHGHNHSDALITLYPSGHIPGAAGVKIDLEGTSIFATGDVLFHEQRIVQGADFPTDPVDVLILETTRGMTARAAHSSRMAEVTRLIESMQEVIDGGGSVLIPAFALGRLQELLVLLHDARSRGYFQGTPIFCAGLGLDLAEYLDQISRKTGLVNFRTRIIKELGLRRLDRNLRPGRSPKNPGIFLVSSGMMVERTPSYGVCASLLGDPQNAIFFVGYCDPDTPGGELLATEDDEPFLFRTLDFKTRVRARRERFDLSGHADREELIDFAESLDPQVIVLTHGDPEARAWFQEELGRILPQTQVIDPPPGQAVPVFPLD